MSKCPPVLQVKNLCKHYPIYNTGFVRRTIGSLKAVDGVSFDVPAGRTFGLVGESGCGKTTTARTILRAVEPTAGSVLFRSNGHEVNLAALTPRQLQPLRPRMQMIFQDPFSSLNPRMTVGRIVGEPLVIHRLAKGTELQDRVAEMLLRVGLKPEHAKRYPHAFSGGQRQRIGIARALIMKPALVVADEPVSALDVSVQAQIINLLRDLQKEFGLSYIFIAHDLSVVKHICDVVGVMYAGRIVEMAPTQELFADPKHPYTKALMASVPLPDPDRKMEFQLAGEVGDLSELPSGCSFHPRCRKCFGPCPQERPRLHSISDEWKVACHLYNRDV